MKKYAMLLLNPLFNPKEHTALFLTENIENHIFTVRSQEAPKKTKDLINKGFGALELCGAFNEKLVQKIHHISEEYLCTGHVRCQRKLKNWKQEHKYLSEDQMRDAMDSVSKHNFESEQITEWSIVSNQSKLEAIYYHREDFSKENRFSLGK